HLVKRSYSEPHWSKKMGSVMAYEKVTLYGVPVVPQRRINYGRVDPELSREMFIRNALVEGDWRTHHKFFHRNRALLEEVEELENRMRRRDIRVDDEALFEFYDARVGKEVVSERHFDKWWKQARHENPALLDFSEDLLRSDEAEELDESAFPKIWQQDGFELPLHYEFSPMVPNAADGVTVTVPILFLNQLPPEPFQWQIPGLRTDMVAALIKSLPKQVRKNFVPAPDVARSATAALAADFDPSADELESSLELTLRRLKGHVIPPGSWNWEAVPPHLKMTFKVVDSAGKVLGEGKDLSALQQELAPASRRAIAESLGATPRTVHSSESKSKRNGQATGKGTAGRGDSKQDGGRAIHTDQVGGNGISSPATAGAAQPADTAGISEVNGQTRWTFGSIDSQVRRMVAGHTITGYPALVDEGTAVGLKVFQSPAEQSSSMRGGVIRLLALRVPSPAKYVLEHLSNHEKLTFSQNPHGSVSSLIDDCTLAAIDKLTPDVVDPAGTLKPKSEAEFDALYEHVRAELIDTMFTVTAVVEKILASARRIEKQLKGSTSLAMIGGLNDIKAQLENLVYPGFVAKTGYAQLSSLPRYLAAVEKRLEKMPSNLQRDGLNMAVVQRLEDEYDDAVAALRPGNGTTAELKQVRWMIEELRVSLFAVELGTAYKVSEKRIRAALDDALNDANAMR
ncbi:MAG TPA: DUF3418 domain-containing protein, partial [Arthrobacter sp.]|nr:DUF3418 domain-containing protein [Arthrobacter sp.]